LTRLLWYEQEGQYLFHIGGSIMQQSTVHGRTIFRTRDAVRTGLSTSWPVPASTGVVEGDDILWVNGEIAAVSGPVTFQAEYLVSSMSDAAPLVGGGPPQRVGTATYHGGYAQLMYYLTDDHDHYDKLAGIFARVTPKENAICMKDKDGCERRGSGAWQIGARYNYLNLNDNGIDGGNLHNLTAGLNWFLNPNMKIRFNYFATHRDTALPDNRGDGWIHGWGTRFAHDF
jgi:phosphate-selective porin OprO and OprP